MKGFAAADISAAAREIDEDLDGDMPPGMDIDQENDASDEDPASDKEEESDSDSDSETESQDLPLAKLNKKLESRLRKYEKAK